MNNIDMALDYLKRASRTLEEAQEAIDAGDYPLAVRRAQETVEMSLKSALRLLAIEYPREHDVHDVLLQASESRKLPEWFLTEVDFMAAVSRDLARKRGPALYGDEQALKPPSSLFTQTDASTATENAERVYQTCKRLVEANRT